MESINDKLEKIACVIDIQGYSLHGKFYARELSIVNDEICSTFNVDPEISLTDDSLNAIYYHYQRIHGLGLHPLKNVFIKNSTLEMFIRVITDMLTSEDKPYLAVKNHQLASLLDEWQIKYVNLESFEAPSVSQFTCRWMCDLHENKRPQMRRCALRKSISLWIWINQKI